MLRLSIGHRLRLEDGAAAEPACQPVDQHRHLKQRVGGGFASDTTEKHPLPTVGSRHRDHLDGEALNLPRQPQPGQPQSHKIDQMPG